MNKQNKIFYNNEMDKKKINNKANNNDKDKYIKLMNDFYDSNLNINDFTDDDFNDIINDFIKVYIDKIISGEIEIIKVIH